MTQPLLSNLLELRESGMLDLFYSRKVWLHCRERVLELDHHECQHCKSRGRYSWAELVHHVKHLEDRPDLALSIYDPDTGERQLISLCKRCHEAEHPESLRQTAQKTAPVTAERWE